MKDPAFTPMDRSRFLRGLLGHSALLGLPGFVSATAPRSVPLLEAHVRGFRFHQGAEVLGSLRAGDALKLVREPANDFDPNAIAVYGQGRKLGYLPREENSTLARLMDQDMRLECTVEETDPGAEEWARLRIRVGLVLGR